jgi:hypothetical protein
MNAGRRAFVKACAAAAAGRLGTAQEKPAVTLIIGDRCRAGALHVPEGGAAFTRAYTVSPAPERCPQAILAGRYPHAPAAPDAASLTSLLGAAAISCRIVDLTRAPRAQTYAGSVAALDGAVADAAGDLRRILVVTAVRGAMLGAHHADDDDTWFEEASRVPLVVRVPGHAHTRELDVLCTSLDILPTILSLCSVRRPESLQGRDLAPFVRGLRADRPESVYTEGGFETAWEWRMLVRGLDKAVFDVNGTLAHLYNLGEDPAEEHDLAGSPALERKTDELMAVAEDVRRRTQDRMDASGLKRR